jgi:predicted transcriptional regulator
MVQILTKQMPLPPEPDVVIKLATEIVVTYLAQNSLSPAEIPPLIRAVREALGGQDPMLESTDTESLARAAEPPPAPGQTPAVPIEQSLTDSYIVSLEDGGRYRSLRRHLMSRYGMTPDDYRRKWGLPASYPMVAPSYAKQRSEVAKRIGLGTRAAGASGAPAIEGARAAGKHRGR